MEAWLDHTEFVSHLARPDVARMIMEAIAFRQGSAWNMFEYVVMPSHLHLFFELLKGGLKNSLERMALPR